jgi:hypothetical protein
LGELETIEVIEAVCASAEEKDGALSQYGLVEQDGVGSPREGAAASGSGGPTLVGPAIPETEHLQGVLMQGGKWPRRLSDQCNSFVDSISEEELYSAHRDKKSQFVHYVCVSLQKHCDFIPAMPKDNFVFGEEKEKSKSHRGKKKKQKKQKKKNKKKKKKKNKNKKERNKKNGARLEKKDKLEKRGEEKELVEVEVKTKAKTHPAPAPPPPDDAWESDGW